MKKKSAGFRDLDRIPKVLDSKSYINLAFGRAKAKVDSFSGKLRGKEKWFKTSEITRIDVASNILSEKLGGILNSFPRIEDISEFNKKLLECFFNVDSYKIELSRVRKAKLMINSIKTEIIRKIKKAEQPLETSLLRKEAFGRFSSILKQISKGLEKLEEYRRELKYYPLVKEDAFTVCIAGFPNVGKSTLMKKITGSNVEIKPYAFTTKQLLIGHIPYRERTIQVIDTPGTLNRKDKMNLIEKQADLAIKELADLIVFVWDPKDEEDKQKRLFKKISKLGKPIVAYISKSDVVEHEDIKRVEAALEKLKPELITTKAEDVKKKVVDGFSNSSKKVGESSKQKINKDSKNN